MVICSHIDREVWTPDFSSSGLADPTWTRLRFQGTELCNSAEWVEWSVAPVQVQICEFCGAVGCGSGGYAHISVLDDLVVWSNPQVDIEERNLYAPASALSIFGAIGFPRSLWDELSATVEGIPGSDEFPPANWQVVADAWAMGKGRPSSSEDLPQFLTSTLVACDTLRVSDAIQLVSTWCEWFNRNGDQPAVSVVGRSEIVVEDETLYVDHPGTEDWTAFARVDGRYFPVLGGTYVVNVTAGQLAPEKQ